MSPWIPLGGATVGWAASTVLTRALVVRGVDTWTMIPFRMLFALLTLFIVMFASKRFWHTDARAWRRGLVLGIVAMALPMVFMTLATEDLPVSLGGLLIALIPLTTIGAAHFIVEGERFQVRSLPGLMIALAGTGVLVGIGGETAEGVDNLWRGVGLMILGIALAGIGGALSRKYALELSGDDLVLPQFTVNTVVMVAVLPFLFEVDVAGIDQVSWWLIVGLGAIGTTLAFTSFLMAATVNPASRLALTGYVIPVLSVILAVIFLDESLTVSIVVGAVLITVGVVLAERNTDHIPEPGVAISR